MFSANDFIPLEKHAKAAPAPAAAPSFWQDVSKRFFSNPFATASLLFLILIIFLAIIGPWLSPYTYYENHLHLKNLPPSGDFWFGTDDLGRDIFTRIWYGARISLFVGFAAALIDLLIGVLYGGFAAFSGGRVDEIMMRFADTLSSIPYMLKVILIMCILGSGLLPILVAMTITGWVNMARIVRGQIIQLKQQEFVLAARALGASSFRILTKHLIPNSIGPIMVTVTLTVPTAIFAEAFLSFLGLGVQVPVASWGTMANDGLPAIRYYPWRLFLPAGFISSTMLAFNIIGDQLRDSLDPKLRSE